MGVPKAQAPFPKSSLSGDLANVVKSAAACSSKHSRKVPVLLHSWFCLIFYPDDLYDSLFSDDIYVTILGRRLELWWHIITYSYYGRWSDAKVPSSFRPISGVMWRSFVIGGGDEWVFRLSSCSLSCNDIIENRDKSFSSVVGAAAGDEPILWWMRAPEYCVTPSLWAKPFRVRNRLRPLDSSFMVLPEMNMVGMIMSWLGLRGRISVISIRPPRGGTKVFACVKRPPPPPPP